ncbi:hypothetical protein [Streptomyces sp. NBC_00273]|uniref:hypothetical protein n=1 Tax=Streptomyces sp. NBC_00273 TaxID=2903644 RepID=UPI002E285C40|nr:hypothetical protein [Streptomyces sp. NBC_00273]
MSTFSVPRTAFVAVAAVAVALTALAGCKDTPSAKGAGPATAPASAAPASTAPASTAPVAGAFEPEAALAEAQKTPYAATMKATTEVAGREAATMSGRANLETVFTGRMEVRTAGDPAIWVETVTTADGNYVRDRSKAGDGWVKVPRSADNQASYTGYAKLLLATGPSAKKGMENQGGVPVYHLSGRLDIDQVASVDPRTHRSMKAKGVTGFDCDQWIDGQGRTVRFDQRMDIHGTSGANKVLFSEFGPVETFARPAEG